MSVTLQEDQVGVAIEVSLLKPGTTDPIDLTNVQSIIFVFLSPAGVRTERTGSVDGSPTEGNVAYVLVTGDLNEPGGWKFQIKLTFIGQTLFSEVGRIKVKANI